MTRTPAAAYGLWELEADNKYLAYRVQDGAEFPLAAYFGELVNGRLTWTRLYASNGQTLGNFVTVHGNEALFRISRSEVRPANNFAIIAVELAQPFRSRVLVAEDPSRVLIRAQHIGLFLVLR